VYWDRVVGIGAMLLGLRMPLSVCVCLCSFAYVYILVCVCLCLIVGADSGSSHAVCVECSNGKKFYADICLVTISLGYLKQHSARLFNPPLPDSKVEAIQRVAMGTCNKIILEFDGQVLPDGIFRLEMVWDYSNDEGETVADRWHKKIGSFEAVADDVLMGERARHILVPSQLSHVSSCVCFVLVG